MVAITGPSGAGKTTLCMCLNGLIPQTFRGEMKGNVIVDGMNTREVLTSDLTTKVGMVFQDPESQFIGMTIEEEVEFGPENLAIPVKEIEKRLEWALRVVDMEGSLERGPYDLSGGQKQRIAIASALVMFPRVLVLDEPTSELDPLGKESVFAALTELRRDRKITVVLVEHNTEEIAKTAHRVILLNNGQIELEAEPQEFFGNVDLLKKRGVEAPQVTEFSKLLLENGFFKDRLPVTMEECYDLVIKLLGRKEYDPKR